MREVKEIYTNPGSPIHVLYGPKVLKDGTIELVEIGKENTDDYIQSFEEVTDMSFILAKLESGDLSVINKRQPFYGDFTEVPKTFAEVLQLRIDAQNMFDRLSADVKEKFDNDVNKFLATAGTEEWRKKVFPKPDVPDPVPDDPEREVTE